jgi:hypothetical protein
MQQIVYTSSHDRSGLKLKLRTIPSTIHLPTSASDVSINRVDVSLYPTRLPVLVCSSSLLCEVFVASTLHEVFFFDSYDRKTIIESKEAYDGIGIHHRILFVPLTIRSFIRLSLLSKIRLESGDKWQDRPTGRSNNRHCSPRRRLLEFLLDSRHSVTSTDAHACVRVHVHASIVPSWLDRESVTVRVIFFWSVL